MVVGYALGAREAVDHRFVAFLVVLQLGDRRPLAEAHGLVLAGAGAQGVDLLAELQFGQDAGIAGCDRLHLRVADRLIGQVLHDLALLQVAVPQAVDELALRLHGLPEEGVRRVGGAVAVDLHPEVLRVGRVEGVALAQDAPLALFDIARTPRHVEVMQGDQPLLNIHSGPHFGGAPDQDPEFAAVHGIEHVLAALGRVVVVDEADLVGRDASARDFQQPGLQFVVDVEIAVALHAQAQQRQLVGRLAAAVLLDLAGQILDLLHQAGQMLLGGAEVAEHQLRAPHVGRLRVDAGDLDRRLFDL